MADTLFINSIIKQKYFIKPNFKNNQVGTTVLLKQ